MDSFVGQHEASSESHSQSQTTCLYRNIVVLKKDLSCLRVKKYCTCVSALLERTFLSDLAVRVTASLNLARSFT